MHSQWRGAAVWPLAVPALRPGALPPGMVQIDSRNRAGILFFHYWTAHMDFHFTPEQEAFRQQIRAFLADHVTPAHRREHEVDHTPGPLSKALLRTLGENGWLGIGWPKEYGGQGRSMMD